ncbi:MAG: hypothetical protein LH478_05010 [Chitinophagaceae bacterium]|nr:hypothetical protein [Chitinophagaceae bacterium]
MEDDKNLRKLLSEGAMVKASADFTNKVMAGISEIQPSPLFETEKWKRIFKTMAALVAAVAIILSFFINPNSLPYSLIEKFSKIPAAYLTILTEYLVAFWILIALSLYMNKGSNTTSAIGN